MRTPFLICILSAVELWTVAAGAQSKMTEDIAQLYRAVATKSFDCKDPTVRAAIVSLREHGTKALVYVLEKSTRSSQPGEHAELIAEILSDSDEAVVQFQQLIMKGALSSQQAYHAIIALAYVGDRESKRVHAVVKALCGIIREGTNDNCGSAVVFLSATDFVRKPLRRDEYDMVADALYSLQDRSFGLLGLLTRGEFSDKLCDILGRGAKEAAEALIQARKGRKPDHISNNAFILTCRELGPDALAAKEILENLRKDWMLREKANKALKAVCAVPPDSKPSADPQPKGR